LAGSAPDVALRSAVARHGLESRVEIVVDPEDGDLAKLYREASVLLFPSLYEGFGWPPLEAMRYGCPVVCSNVASLPEVVDDAALLCNPADTDECAAALLRVLNDEMLAKQLVERGYRNLSRFGSREFALGLSRLYEGLAMSQM
jgi:glycosyltransferase involved in cell wall biosynthesis